MKRKNTQNLNRILSLCRMQKLDEAQLYARAKMILSIYRSACWSTIGRAEEVREDLIYYCGSQLDDALIYLETFAQDEMRERFEERIQDLFETKWMMELMETAMLHIKDYPVNGDLYFEILAKCYLNRFRYREPELLELLDMERSCFYDRKKEAILVFGLALWGKSIPQLKEFLHEGMELEEELPKRA